MSVICGVDKDGRVYPLGVKYDQGTGLASIVTSRGGGKNTFTAELTQSYTDLVIVNPTFTQKVCVASVYLCGEGTTGVVELDFAVGAIKVFRHYMTKYNQSFVSDMHIEGALNGNLLLTNTTGTDKAFLVVNYRLVS